jgi:copper chaperone CopZ
MKTIASAVLTLLLISSLTQEVTAQKSKDEKTVVIEASMDCNSCKAKIEKNIAFEKGVKDLKVNLETKQVTILYQESKNSDENLVKAIEKLGFTAKIVDQNATKDCETKTQECPKKGDGCTGKKG